MTVYNSDQVQNTGQEESQNISSLVSSMGKVSILYSLPNHQSQVEPSSGQFAQSDKKQNGILRENQDEEEQIDDAKDSVENAVAPHDENNGLVEEGHSNNLSQEKIKTDDQKDDSDVEWNRIHIPTKVVVTVDQKDEEEPIDKDAKDTLIDENAVTHNDADGNENDGLVEEGHLNNLSQEKIKTDDQKDDSDVEWNRIHIPTKEAVTIDQKTPKVCSGSDDEKNEEDEETEEKGSDWCLEIGEEDYSDDENQPEDDDEPVKEGKKQLGQLPRGWKVTTKVCSGSDDEKNEEDEETEEEENKEETKEKNKYEEIGEEDYSDDENQPDDDESVKEEKNQPRLLQRGLVGAGSHQPQHYAQQNNFAWTTWQGTYGGHVVPPSNYPVHSYCYASNEPQSPQVAQPADYPNNIYNTAGSHQPQHHAQQNSFPEAQWQGTLGDPVVAPSSYAVPYYGYVLSPEVAQPANYPEISSMQEAVTESHMYDTDEYNSSSSGPSSPEQETSYQSVLADENDIELVLEVVEQVKNDDKYLPVPAKILKGILDYFETPSADNPKLVWEARAEQRGLPAQPTKYMNSNFIPISHIQDNLVKKSPDSMWKRNLNKKRLLHYRKELAKISNEVLTAKDEDGDTPSMIVVSRTDSVDYMEKLVAMIERQKDIPMCCDKFVSKAGVCSNCKNTDENTFYSPLSMRNNQCESILSCVIQMQCPVPVINYIIEKIKLRKIDVQRLSDQSSLRFYYQHLDKYPALSEFLCDTRSSDGGKAVQISRLT